jgi:hypothetical protein
MILWANLHGSFPIGYALASVLGAEALIFAPRELRAETALHWGAFLGAIFLAGFVTPYGYRAVGVTFGLFRNGESLPYITEWQPLGFDTVGIAADGLLALILVGLSVRPKENVFRILLVALFGYLTFKHGRFISLFVFVVPMLAAEPLVRRFPRWAALGPEQGSGPLSRSATTGLVLAVIGIGLVKAPEPSPRTTPTAAVREARARGIAGPVYNDYDFGGFLIGAGVKTFIDGRTDQLFLDGFIGRWAEAVHAVDARPFAQLLDSHQVSWALVKPASDEVRHLTGLPGWRLAYADVSAAIYVRN